MAPTVVCGALKGAVFAANIYEKLGYSVVPNASESRHDIIQAVTFGSADGVIAFCQGIQAAAPVDSYVTPEPWAMPGYDSEVIMAAGAFVQGSSIELSADGPIKPPYAVYFQGGLTWQHAKLGIWDTNAFRDRAPYLLPQETGNHEDVRWAEITDDSGHGLRVSQTANTETGVTKPFAMSLLPYSSTMLEEALHQDELPEPKHMFLRVLAAQMGVGGDDSWMSPVHEQYQLPADQPLNLDVALDLF